MKIKHRLKYCAMLSAVFVAVGMIGVVGLRIAEDTKNASAQENGDGQADYLSDYEEAEIRGSILGEIEEEYIYQHSDIEAPTLEAAGSLPAKYDLRDEYAVRQKDQHSEGMCWLYSGVTALEYSLAKKYENYEVSVKHLDYMTTDAHYEDNDNDIHNDVYKQANKTNAYFDRYLNAGGYHRWSLGTSGANQELIYSILDPLAIVSESDFTNVLKANDSRLASINRYEDIWSLDNKNDILKKNGEGYSSYMEKQDYYKVNDASKVKYIVTGAKLGGYAFDESRTVDSDVVKNIKSIINDYGAVKISTFGTPNRIDNCSDKKTVGDRNMYTFIVDNRVVRKDPNDPESEILYECKADHGMTIVGWDDDWEYEYNGETKKGAFILQNSWGEKEHDKMKWHLSYTSNLPSLMYFDSVEKYNDYDRYYGVKDYKKQTIEPDSDEYIFEFSLDNSEELEAFVFSELYGAYEYDVYVSNTGKAGDFKKDGKFNSVAGIAKYEFNNKYEIANDYAIKIKRVNGRALSDADRIRGTMNVMSDKIWALNIYDREEKTRETCRLNGDSCSVKISTKVPTRTGYYFLGYADTASATVAKYQPGDTIMLSADKEIYALWADGKIEWKENQTYTKASGNDVVLRINYPLEKFVTLKIDGAELDNTVNDKYKLEFGSTIITVYGSYLDTLAAGDHTMQVVYDNGVVKEANFTINEIDDTPSEDEEEISEDEEELPVPNTAAVTPNTGGNTTNNVGGGDILIYALPVSCVVLAGGIFMTKRNKSHRKFD